MAIIRKEAYFNSSTGKNKIRCLLWQDETAVPRAVFQIAHGVAEHIERYDDFARFLAENGFVVCGNDHIGHGKSVDSVDELGYTADKDGNVRMVDDMHILTHIMRKRYPDLPYFLFGHSMGSFCARVYTAHFGQELDGVIYCGTGDFPPILGLLDEPIDKLVEKIGADKASAYLSDLFNRFSNRQFAEGAKTPFEWLSKDESIVEKYVDDPLCGFPFKFAVMRDLLKLAAECAAGDWAEKVPLDLPIMIVSGAKDPVGSNGKGVLSVADKLENTGHDPTVILYPNDRHEILNETDHDKIYQDILKWLNQTLGEKDKAAQTTE